MADQKITELPIKGTSGINLADYLLGIDSAEGYQMLISDLAKKIVESYSGSSLAGSSRTLKNALDTIASNAGGNMATIESGTTASKAYAVGDYMVRNGQLYKVTAAIASGGTITVGTNVAAAAAADDIAGIGKKIGNTAMGTTATTITGAIKEHETDIGSMSLNTTATDLTGAINEHEADISELNGNSGIQNITLRNATPGGNTSFYYKKSNVVTFFIDLTPSTSGTSLTVATLPAGFRPPAVIRYTLTPVVHDSTDTIGTAFALVNNNGDIQFYMTSAKRVFLSGSFAIA